MTVGVLQVELSVGQARSLKDKRRVIKGLKDRLNHAFNASVAEVDYQDEHQRSALAAAVVGTDRRYVESVLSKIVDHVRDCRAAILLDYTIELW